MTNRYHLTTEENLFIARRNKVDYIWKEVCLLGHTFTYIDVVAVVEGFPTDVVDEWGVELVKSLDNAWSYILSNIGYLVNYNFLSKVNELVTGNEEGNMSCLTNEQIDEVDKDLVQILKAGTSTDKAINLMLYIMRKQLFVDGNKRTAMLAANKIMIAEGAGVISVTLEDQPKFRELLVSFYETGNELEIKRFVYDHCIDGMVF